MKIELDDDTVNHLKKIERPDESPSETVNRILRKETESPTTRQKPQPADAPGSVTAMMDKKTNNHPEDTETEQKDGRIEESRYEDGDGATKQTHGGTEWIGGGKENRDRDRGENQDRSEDRYSGGREDSGGVEDEWWYRADM